MRSTGKRQFMLALTGLLPAVLLALSAVPAGAQAAAALNPNRGPIPAYNAAHEITINGTVQQVVTKRTVGSPAGMHLMISGAQGLVDAHVGPYLNKSMQQAIHAGLPLKVVGVAMTIRGKEFVAVRQLIYGGQTVTVRNSKGFLLKSAQSSASPGRLKPVHLGGGL